MSFTHFLAILVNLLITYSIKVHSEIFEYPQDRCGLSCLYDKYLTRQLEDYDARLEMKSCPIEITCSQFFSGCKVDGDCPGKGRCCVSKNLKSCCINPLKPNSIPSVTAKLSNISLTKIPSQIGEVSGTAALNSAITLKPLAPKYKVSRKLKNRKLASPNIHRSRFNKDVKDFHKIFQSFLRIMSLRPVERSKRIKKSPDTGPEKAADPGVSAAPQADVPIGGLASDTTKAVMKSIANEQMARLGGVSSAGQLTSASPMKDEVPKQDNKTLQDNLNSNSEAKNSNNDTKSDALAPASEKQQMNDSSRKEQKDVKSGTSPSLPNSDPVKAGLEKAKANDNLNRDSADKNIPRQPGLEKVPPQTDQFRPQLFGPSGNVRSEQSKPIGEKVPPPGDQFRPQLFGPSGNVRSEQSKPVGEKVPPPGDQFRPQLFGPSGNVRSEQSKPVGEAQFQPGIDKGNVPMGESQIIKLIGNPNQDPSIIKNQEPAPIKNVPNSAEASMVNGQPGAIGQSPIMNNQQPAQGPPNNEGQHMNPPSKTPENNIPLIGELRSFGNPPIMNESPSFPFLENMFRNNRGPNSNNPGDSLLQRILTNPI